jgi:hypothetical protein
VRTTAQPGKKKAMGRVVVCSQAWHVWELALQGGPKEEKAPIPSFGPWGPCVRSRGQEDLGPPVACASLWAWVYVNHGSVLYCLQKAPLVHLCLQPGRAVWPRAGPWPGAPSRGHLESCRGLRTRRAPDGTPPGAELGWLWEPRSSVVGSGSPARTNGVG